MTAPGGTEARNPSEGLAGRAQWSRGDRREIRHPSAGPPHRNIVKREAAGRGLTTSLWVRPAEICPLSLLSPRPYWCGCGKAGLWPAGQTIPRLYTATTRASHAICIVPGEAPGP